jgi:hypothetical protein
VTKPDGRHLILVQAPRTGGVLELSDAASWRGQIVAARHIT